VTHWPAGSPEDLPSALATNLFRLPGSRDVSAVFNNALLEILGNPNISSAFRPIRSNSSIDTDPPAALIRSKMKSVCRPMISACAAFDHTGGVPSKSKGPRPGAR
jgi:hypothetical protein